ncbi:MAG TPA: hypothetical protein VGQ57_15080, partial [Polyangiaceae bacterium]|nr:hypothetical protein [Polyangiaceae bacterium]
MAVRGIARELACWDDDEGESAVMQRCVTRLAQALPGAYAMAIYSLDGEGDSFRVPCWEQVGLGAGSSSAAIDFMGRYAGRRYGMFDPKHPEPWNRNRLVEYRDVVARGIEEPPMAKALFPRFGVRFQHQARVLVCDGPVVLGWVGGFFERLTARDRRVLRAVIPGFQRRWRLQRAVAAAPMLEVALQASLEALPRAAFIASKQGALLEANALGRA